MAAAVVVEAVEAVEAAVLQAVAVVQAPEAAAETVAGAAEAGARAAALPRRAITVTAPRITAATAAAKLPQPRPAIRAKDQKRRPWVP